MQGASMNSVRLVRTVALSVCLAGAVYALDPAHTLFQYGHAAWTSQDGRLPGGVYALTQTRDGWFWVGTEFGLFRFDGVTFMPLEPPGGELARGQSITALAPAPDGGLWIGTRKGVLHWNGSLLQHYGTVHGIKVAPVRAIRVDRRGIVWVGTVGFDSGGLARVEGAALHFYSPSEGFTGGGVQAVMEDHDNNLWIACVNGLYHWDGVRFMEYGSNGALKRINAIVEGLNGDIILGSRANGALKRLTRETYQDYPVAKFSAPISTGVLLMDRDGGLWIGTDGKGLMHIHEGVVDQFTRADGLSGNIVLNLFEDREGNIWAGTERGLDRFGDLPVTILSKREGLSNDAAGSVFAARSGGMWVGTSAGLNRVEGNRITVFDRRAGLPSEGVGSIYEDHLARLWVDSPLGMAVRSNGRFHPMELHGAEDLRSVTAAVEDRDGVLWFADQGRGLVALQSAAIKKVIPWSFFNNRQAWALDSDVARTELLIGFAQGGVVGYKEGLPVRWYTAEDGLGAGAVTDIHTDGEGTAWIATQGGLSRLRDGRVTTLNTTNGLVCDQIQSMVEDESGALWLNTVCGLQSVAKKELAAWAAKPNTLLHPRLYSSRDGMYLRPAITGFFRRAARSADGRLWFPVFDGVAVVDPLRLRANPFAPPVAIEMVRVNNRTYIPTTNLSIGPVTKELEVDYTAFSSADSDRVRFRYTLEGYDKGWSEVVGRRQAFYSRLSPGHYRFRVTACNNDGVWNERGASFDFDVAPTVYQTAWFRLLCLAALAALLWNSHWVRLRYLRTKMQARFEERLRERTRIGQELHDTLLQNMAGFALQLDGLSKIVTQQPQSAKETLCELRQETEHWLHEARESVWELRLPADEPQDYCEAVRLAGEQMTRNTPVQFSLAISGDKQLIPPRVQEHLLRIAREVLGNAVRHASATEVQVYISFSEQSRIWTHIRDNGCGFDLAAASRKPGHFGLSIIRERAQEVGAAIKFKTAPGQGTEIEITMENPPGA
jgi:signal transduction histidine kinase